MSAENKNYSPKELLELASLDALGLLDRDERESFEAAFRTAPPSLQAQVRREQGRIASADEWLPDVAPPSSLRDRVLMAVRGAIAAVRGEGDVIARIVPGEWSVRANVSPLWRAACIGFAAATVTLLVAGSYIQGTYSQTLADYQSGITAEIISTQFGQDFAERWMSPTARHVNLAPADGMERAAASIVIDQSEGAAMLVVKDLPIIEGEYVLQLIRPDGRKQQLCVLVNNGKILRQDFEPIELETGSNLHIVQRVNNNEAGEPILFRSI
ncbi:MAG: hypothetical protein VYC34_04300 [Planctomycetota bacterium]|nr:hypothetical protein [Planctomycetota bacterium]